ncbi:MAG: 1-acyl-sn-glycerol-3-phosphate acyltransferase [Treponema sp.]|nr:1-acyl-sn-glycerol-3-phosphate acyltransferase [Treponema sp.]
MSANDLPPIKNYPAWLWRIFRKVFVVVFFGIGTIIIGAIVFPILRLFNPKKTSFKKAGHKFISLILDFYIHLMSWVRISTYKINDLKAMRNLRGCVIVANHPSLLDVIYTLAFVRDADCIVKAGLKKSLVSVIVKNLYITNNVDFEIMQKDCVEALHNGGNLIIFPEGTRTPRHGTNQYKKGAARIALAAGANVQPMHIGGNDKYGLGKGESLLLVNHTERYKYEFTILPQIEMSKYAGLSETIAAKRLTDDMRTAIENGSSLC